MHGTIHIKKKSLLSAIVLRCCRELPLVDRPPLPGILKTNHLLMLPFPCIPPSSADRRKMSRPILHVLIEE